jgi:hypothetical protein
MQLWNSAASSAEAFFFGTYSNVCPPRRQITLEFTGDRSIHNQINSVRRKAKTSFLVQLAGT